MIWIWYLCESHDKFLVPSFAIGRTRRMESVGGLVTIISIITPCACVCAPVSYQFLADNVPDCSLIYLCLFSLLTIFKLTFCLSFNCATRSMLQESSSHKLTEDIWSHYEMTSIFYKLADREGKQEFAMVYCPTNF